MACKRLPVKFSQILLAIIEWINRREWKYLTELYIILDMGFHILRKNIFHYELHTF